MLAKILLLLLIFGGTNLFAQDYVSVNKLVINNQTFIIKAEEVNKGKALLTIKRNSRNILKDSVDSGGLFPLSFPDFNNDGNKDILLTYGGNNFSYTLYLFDKMTNTYKYLKGFDKFPEAKQLKSNSKYYYSYQRAGCADLNWVSDLFYIQNFQTIHIGHIYGQGCDFEIQANPQIINIYKVINNNEENEKLIKSMPLLKTLAPFESKWGFIANYWNQNFSTFK